MLHAGDVNSSEPAESTVLIVEDERVSRRALASLLTASGYRTTAYECAEDALHEMNGEAAPSIALLDVDLPGMSGLDLACELESLRPGVTIVLITAAGGDRIDQFRIGHRVHYLSKPLDFGRLLTLLDKPRAPN